MLMKLGEKKVKAGGLDNVLLKGIGEGRAAVKGTAFTLSRRQKNATIAYTSLAGDEQIEGCTDPG